MIDSRVTLPYKKMKLQKFLKEWQSMGLYASLTLYFMDLIWAYIVVVESHSSMFGGLWRLIHFQV